MLENVLAGQELSEIDAIHLFRVEGADLDALTATADETRRRRVGDDASFVITRNINYTNVCYMGCRFCNFAKRKDDPGAEFFDLEEIVRRAQEAWDRGATEVCIQAACIRTSPDILPDMLKAIKRVLPDMHIHAFSPFEIWFGAHKSRLSYRDFIRDLVDNGLGSMPGTAAEILDTEVRKQLTRDKLTTDQWVEIITTATRRDSPHIDHHVWPYRWPRALGGTYCPAPAISRSVRGFTEFVPLGFVHYKTPCSGTRGRSPGTTRLEHIRMHAVARLMLDGWIDNIQAPG
ncbi:aminodeoxyfutalosine synthase [Halomonas elongata]|uniref:Aminodeoxyfutalosine synthase n=1 Tax=Halomonas elongata TaxID=2746 RepID=A0A1B8P7D6_HALEL|nr:radical SAM protein [Halomonas elongata]OBX38139.1 aminodeoxyfutalosine synthase [Halomonas elongata]